jgi:predicted Rossmann-fold nucleotide-binding protein
MIKVFVNVKTGGAVGTMEVANSLLNQGGQSGHNIPPLPQPQGGYLPPQAIHASSPNPQPVINNHYHVASKKKKNDLEEKVNLVKFPN